jgi:hypothetical protein
VNRPLVPRQQAINAIRDADLRFQYALYGMDTLSERLRRVADAANEESRAMELAVLANIEWPGRSAELFRLGSEVEPGQQRPGPKRLWTEVDRALSALTEALAGSSMKDLAAAYQQLSVTTRALADALQQPAVARQTA